MMIFTSLVTNVVRLKIGFTMIFIVALGTQSAVLEVVKVVLTFQAYHTAL